MDKSESTKNPPVAYLLELESKRKIPITTPRCQVGRDPDNEIVISDDNSVSRVHFVITYDGGQYKVEDQSRHGTYINGNQVAEAEPINDGDVLKAGASLFWVVFEHESD